MKSKNKIAHLLPCHLALAAHGAVDVAACLPMAMEQLHYLLVNSSVRTGMCTAQWKEGGPINFNQVKLIVKKKIECSRSWTDV